MDEELTEKIDLKVFWHESLAKFTKSYIELK